MAINSRAKGAKGERELAGILRDYGYNCRRGQQYSGLEGEDVVGLDYIHIECKRVQSLNIEKALQQSKRDAKENQIPAVFHRKNKEKWKVTLDLADFMKLYNEFYSGKKLEEREASKVITALEEKDGDVYKFERMENEYE